ncbi:RHS repeat-associated protein [Actinokineospora baliensis]|uniref:golvesin C-terminal-like domain-containing protein n=1 Tax=Actinokineospora baliensis TaxID=547056 RepID=UPI00195EADB2|nr:deaminase [Actinokineospora baliensis]MBM7774763.1 RHS repeat-associated protein [Actinokineospora baliensis]
MARTTALFGVLAVSAVLAASAQPVYAAPTPTAAAQVEPTRKSTRCPTTATPPPAVDRSEAPAPRQFAFARQKTAATYTAPDTPLRMIPGDTYPVKVELSNTTTTTWTKGSLALSYHWTLAPGDQDGRTATPLPSDLTPGQSATIEVPVVAPIAADIGNTREQWVLRWDLRDTKTRRWLSDNGGPATLDQPTTVENPTSDQLGLEKYFQFTGTATGGGTAVSVNQYSGNAVLSHNILNNPSRGLSTFARITYNSLDASNSYAGRGWSVTASTLQRLGTPLQFDGLLGTILTGHPSKITLVDGDGTGHTFELNKHDTGDTARWTYDPPAGFHTLLRRDPGRDDSKRWVFTGPDRTSMYFDAEGYQSASVDRNGNQMTFHYERGAIGNRGGKLLTHLTDAAGRRTLTLDYYRPGDDATVFHGDRRATEKAGLSLLNQLRSITDASGRVVTFAYTDNGQLRELVDGAGTPDAKVYGFLHDSAGVLARVVDPNGGASQVQYYDRGDRERKGRVRAAVDRAGGVLGFDYADPDGDKGSAIASRTTDANGHSTDYVVDGYGRVERISNAKGETTQLAWDADNNVVRIREDNGATTTWRYDPKTGYPLEIRDAESHAQGYPGTALTYRTELDGYVADLVERRSPEGRRWLFVHDERGNLVSITDPKGTATPDEGDYTSRYTYDELGHLTTTTDANGHRTTYADYDASGYPRRITDPLDCSSLFAYDEVGNVVSTLDAKRHTSTFGYDVFRRPLASRVPKDAAAGAYITTPGAVYDGNDNVVKLVAANGAVTSTQFDALDRQVAVTSPRDDGPDAPVKTATFTYDPVGNLIRQVDPKGTLTPDPDDYVTAFRYDEVDQVVEVTDAAGKRMTVGYDRVGNTTQEADRRKTATADPDDFTIRHRYDLNHRVVESTDATGATTKTKYSPDGNVVETVDEDGNATTTTYDERSLPVELKEPHDKDVYFTTRYEYDQVGNRTKTTTPRGVRTGDDPDDFVHATVYDELNRVAEEVLPFDRDDSSVPEADRILNSYDELGNLTEVSSPPSKGQSARNKTRYTYYDNNWTRTSTDAWGISTLYDYNAIGQQTNRTRLSEGGGSARVQSWTYHPDGKKKTRSDGGVPVGQHVVVVDNSDDDTEVTGTWATVADEGQYEGFDYRTHPAGSGDDKVTWKADIPASGTYEVAVRYTGATANDARYTVEHNGGTAEVTVDQSKRPGEWVALGSYEFTEDEVKKITLGTSATGSVTADAVRLVRDNRGDTDAEEKRFEYRYDANDNQVLLRDNSSGALVDEYSIRYDVLNRADLVEERESGAVKRKTAFSFNENGNVTKVEHDDQVAVYDYDARDLVTKAVNRQTGDDAREKTTTFAYTARAHLAKQTKHNGNTVDFEYYLDGLTKHQVERKSGGAVVNEHRLEYDDNKNRTRDVAKKQDADSKAVKDNDFRYTFDPRDRVREVKKTGDSPSTETYEHDANNNVSKQTVGGTTTEYAYDRDRLLSATTAGTTSTYGYDPWGRLRKVSSAGRQVEKYVYDGFDHTAEHRAGSGAAQRTTKYAYDPLDRTVSETSTGGGAKDKKVELLYLGLSEQVLTEKLNDKVSKSYQYSPDGELLSQINVKDDGGKEDKYYAFNPHSDVESMSGESGDATATYGYTAYGQDDQAGFSGEDKPGAQEPGAQPANSYRFNSKRFDSSSGNYDMGFRDYSPSQNRFLTLDLYNGALDDLGLSTNPFTANRYSFGGGNPISAVEIDGHLFGLSFSDIGHAALDVAGLIPGVGEIADVANGIWYAAEGNYADAALSFASAVPLAGYGASAVKAGKYAKKGADAVQAGDKVKDAAKTASKVDPPPAAKAADPPPAAKPKADPPPTPKKDAAPSCKGNSFAGDTPVVMADGSRKPISRVRVGELVLATDPVTGVSAAEPVTEVITGFGVKDLVELTVGGGTVVATAGHPFWVAGEQDWRPAGLLRVGDQVSVGGETARITAVRTWTSYLRVHNLTVDGIHTFHAGAAGVVVHNDGCDPFKDLADYRAREGMPKAGAADDVHTAARLDVGGQSFYGRNAHDLPVDMKVNAQTRTHAEGHAFQQAKNAGATGERATLYVDRDLCRSCGRYGGLGSLMRATGVSELVVHSPAGRFLVTASRPSVPRPLGG